MCIVIVKSRGAAMPADETLKTCFQNNPDGFGFMVQRAGEKQLIVDKGYFYYPDIKAALANAGIDKDDLAVLHFRIATAGQINAGCCHPFPITDNVKLMQQRKLTCTQAVVHNGILGAGEKKLSDTMVFIRDELYPLKDNLSDPSVQDLIATSTEGSRLCIVDAAQDLCILTGSWTTVDGVHYSNKSYKYQFGYDLLPCDYTINDNNWRFCPSCQGFDYKLISKYHRLYECKNCHCVFDENFDVFV